MISAWWNYLVAERAQVHISLMRLWEASCKSEYVTKGISVNTCCCRYQPVSGLVCRGKTQRSWINGKWGWGRMSWLVSPHIASEYTKDGTFIFSMTRNFEKALSTTCEIGWDLFKWHFLWASRMIHQPGITWCSCKSDSRMELVLLRIGAC